ncbi:hypothetical protein Z043_101826 [Scleropages formosus]|uniref:RING-type domain-containing protein n=1 Tax=Scleropages formosus TaxID=113540 RepID=A0A0P7ZCI1_SCLFO|nr:hypothetical protein Z043_101826 [Scleropages formosus]
MQRVLNGTCNLVSGGRRPKVLDCCHRLCAKCLTKIMDLTDIQTEVVICPFCRYPTTLPQSVGSIPDDCNIMTALRYNRRNHALVVHHTFNPCVAPPFQCNCFPEKCKAFLLECELVFSSLPYVYIVPLLTTSVYSICTDPRKSEPKSILLKPSFLNMANSWNSNTTNDSLSNTEEIQPGMQALLVSMYTVALIGGTTGIVFMSLILKHQHDNLSITNISILNLVVAHGLFLLTLPFRIDYYITNYWQIKDHVVTINIMIAAIVLAVACTTLTIQCFILLKMVRANHCNLLSQQEFRAQLKNFWFISIMPVYVVILITLLGHHNVLGANNVEEGFAFRMLCGYDNRDVKLPALVVT